MISKIYKAFSFIKRRIVQSFSHLITLIKFKCFNIQFGKFKTYGVPFIDIAYNYGGSIAFSDGLELNNGMYANQIGFGNDKCVFRVANGTIKVGKNVGISHSTLCAFNADIIIGNDVQIGGGVRMYTTNFHSLYYLDRRQGGNDVSKCATIKIEDDCFIGSGALILKGVTIGARSIIGANSVVTKSIPCDSIACGNPARLI